MSEEDQMRFDRCMTVGHAELKAGGAGNIANSVLAFQQAIKVAYAPFAAAHAHVMLGKALRLQGKTEKAHNAFATAKELAANHEGLLKFIEREEKGGA